MSNKRRIKNFSVILIAAILIIIVSQIVYARVSASNIVCTETGSLNFKLSYACNDDNCENVVGMPTSRLKINATSDDKVYKIEWIDPPKSIYDDRSYDFISKDNILDPNREYNLTIYDKEDVTQYSVTCPDFKFRCSKINLNIDLCMEEELDFYFLFSGLGEQFSENQLREQLDYYINPARTLKEHQQARFKQSEEIPSSFIVNNLGSDKYVLKISSLDLKNQFLGDIYIKVKGCDEDKFNVSDYSSCKRQKCYSNDHCPIGAYCDTNKQTCKVLFCSSCEKLSGHECASICKPRNKCEEATCDNSVCKYTPKENCCVKNLDCDDNLVCTIDTCENNKCINKKIECKASGDPCVIGVCEEPNGCKYVKNPECDKKSDENATSQKITGQAVKQIEKPKTSFFGRLISAFKMLFGGE